MTTRSSKNGAITLFHMNFCGYVGQVTIFSRMLVTACCLVVGLGLGLGFSVWLVIGYEHVFIPLSIDPKYRLVSKCGSIVLNIVIWRAAGDTLPVAVIVPICLVERWQRRKLNGIVFPGEAPPGECVRSHEVRWALVEDAHVAGDFTAATEAAAFQHVHCRSDDSRLHATQTQALDVAQWDTPATVGHDRLTH